MSHAREGIKDKLKESYSLTKHSLNTRPFRQWSVQTNNVTLCKFNIFIIHRQPMILNKELFAVNKCGKSFANCT